MFYVFMFYFHSSYTAIKSQYISERCNLNNCSITFDSEKIVLKLLFHFYRIKL